jgi:UDP-N-acetylglucosamine--N-acetylmuramyl-(pentapeptide) pyrophosphoryl-undecaprenol N-acetylglucosamine transferase
MTNNGPTILFAGGGSGGHIFPSIAIAQRVAEIDAPVGIHFLVSNRSIDATVMADHQYAWTASPATPLPRKPTQVCSFFKNWLTARKQASELIRTQQVKAVLCAGGFVSGAIAAEARRKRIPVILLNLDATPGIANRWLSKRVDHVYTVYKQENWHHAECIGLPLRREAIGPEDKAEARVAMGLNPTRRTLLVVGGSQSARSINEMMLEMAYLSSSQQVMRQWQILHISGNEDAERLEVAYRKANINAVVLPFTQKMGFAWRSASAAISRSGAGSVAEVWHNAVPTLFMPYPYHKDLHQLHNAQPLVDAGAALLLTDHIDPVKNAHQVINPLTELMVNKVYRQNMVDWLTKTRPVDGADIVARALLRHVR